MRFNGSLEEINRFCAVWVGRNFLAACVVHLRHLVDERHNVAQEFHQTAHTHIFSGTNAEHREDTACHKTLANALAHFVFGKCFGLEELLHQCFIVLSSSLDQRFVQLHRLVHFLGRYLFDDGSTAFGFPTVLLHQQDINDAVEACARCGWILYLYTL